MEFRTRIDYSVRDVTISHSTQMMLLGSCFSEEIGRKLVEHKFRVEINPFGILYNPLSVSHAIERIITGEPFTSEELFFHNGMYHSPMHHGAFSSSCREQTLQMINQRYERAVALLPQTDLLLITFGTAWVYRRKEDQQIVANCHKLPADHFNRSRMTVAEIAQVWEDLINRLLQLNPGMKLIFTVSPVRHLKDGAHENQLSKAVLLLAIEQLQSLFPICFFFKNCYGTERGLSLDTITKAILVPRHNAYCFLHFNFEYIPTTKLYLHIFPDISQFPKRETYELIKFH